MIDTHSHLFDESFQEDIEACIDRCRQVNVNKIVLVGFSHTTNERAQEFAQRYSLFYPTAGLHPSEASLNYKEDLIKLDQFIRTHKVYAIGECGLDYHYGKEQIEEQKKLFRGQIELSIKYKLPLIIHMRDATQDTYEILKEYTGEIFGVMHCYSGSLEMAKEFIKLGFYISLGGPVTFKNAKESKRIAESIDLDKLLVETDCPYLAPTPYRGQRNESSYVKNVVLEIAELRNMEFSEIESITEQNAKKLFNLEDRL
ncbi:MAG: TatD family hydrolase, partial [Anaeroplasmataceae bacterium]|nr:TatD family hydrolase [Anaeroplasmataceae bacterium]